MVLTCDYGMKLLADRYREKQRDWFAQRGTNVHIGVGNTKEDDQKKTLTVSHFLDGCVQDSPTTAAILVSILKTVKERKPFITKVKLRADNAGCYHSNYMMLAVKEINRMKLGITIERFDFSEPQAGKSIADRRAAHLKGHFRRECNSGIDLITAKDRVLCLKKMNIPDLVAIEAVPPIVIDKVKNAVTIPNISNLNNFLFTKQGVRVWRQYNIGKGKLIHLKVSDYKGILPILSERERSDTNVASTNSTVPAARPPVIQSTAHDLPSQQRLEQPSSSSNNDNSNSDDDGGLFPCTEDGCVQVFARFGNLTRHLDSGTHKYAKEATLSLSDRSKILYSEKIAQQAPAIPKIDAFRKPVDDNGDVQEIFNKGFALKGKRSAPRFNEKQKKYMEYRFNEGNRTGVKAQADEIASDMQSVRDEDGKRLFSRKEFLKEAQVAAYISRLVVQRKKKMEPSDEDIALETSERKKKQIKMSLKFE